MQSFFTCQTSDIAYIAPKCRMEVANKVVCAKLCTLDVCNR